MRLQEKHYFAQCPLHHVTYAHKGYEVTMSKGLGGYVFTRKFII